EFQGGGVPRLGAPRHNAPPLPGASGGLPRGGGGGPPGLVLLARGQRPGIDGPQQSGLATPLMRVIAPMNRCDIRPLKHDHFQLALELLLQAHDYVHELGCPAWDFAVELSGLLALGVSANDLRWL